MCSLAEKLRSVGYEVLVTVRDYDYTVSVAKLHDVEVRVVGRYGGGRLEGKLLADAERIAELTKLIAEYKPSAAIMYPSPSGARVAFGLAVPLVVLSDSPHSTPAHRLALPLASALIHSSFIPRQLFEEYLHPSTLHLTYHGVDELQYIERYLERGPLGPPVEEALGVEPMSYIVVRPPEYKAAYYAGRRVPPVLEAARLAVEAGLKVVYLPRYPEQVEDARRRIPGDKLIVPSRAVDGLDLEAKAVAVVTGGASMAREAALLGTPAATLYPGTLVVDEVLRLLGFPLAHLPGGEGLIEWMERVLSGEVKRGSTPTLRLLEPPLKTVVRALGELLDG